MSLITMNLAKKVNSHNEWKLEMTGVTLGMVLSIRNALDAYKEISPVGHDTFLFLDNAIRTAGVDPNAP